MLAQLPQSPGLFLKIDVEGRNNKVEGVFGVLLIATSTLVLNAIIATAGNEGIIGGGIPCPNHTGVFKKNSVLQVQVKVRSSFLNLLSNETMIKKYEEYTTQLGTEVDTDETHQALGGGSTDMGNVSYEVPSIHPDFAIGSDCNTHTKEFTPAAGNTGC